jgi:formamidopyrimidine-DNA glycosylase
MPESPEVEVLTAFVRDRATGHGIRSVDLEEFGALKTRGRSPAELEGRTITGAERRGKHLVISTDGSDLVVGFGRAGWLRWVPAGSAAADPRDAAPIGTVTLDDGDAMVVTDAGSWLSVGLWVVDDAAEVPSIAGLGPDPLLPEFSRADLERVLVGRRKQLKALLQEQGSLAGIGGAYSDEILHVAQLPPLAHAASLDERDRDRLHGAVRGVLADALAARTGVPIDRLKAHKVASMRVHGRTGQPCPVCGGAVADIPGSKGGAQHCPSCQPDR